MFCCFLLLLLANRQLTRFVELKLAGVLVFSAIPFTAVKAIANSTFGETLRKRLEEKKKVAVENSAKFRALAQMARNDR